jgi:hypothetical protein
MITLLTQKLKISSERRERQKDKENNGLKTGNKRLRKNTIKPKKSQN